MGGNTFKAIEYFALVAYLPEPLSGFLTKLRNELDPRYPGKPHLTILPPRRLSSSWQEAWQQVREIVESSPAVDIELGDVRVFEASQVVYVEVRRGCEELQQLHRLVNSGLVRSVEVWEYQPHVTLAHRVAGLDVHQAANRVQRQWAAYRHERSFEVSRLTWVKTTIVPGVSDHGTRSPVASDSEWVDLAESRLTTRVGA